jgi:DNA-binding HxlR family transcriptional regulator
VRATDSRVDAEELGRSLAVRLAEIAAALERYAAFSFSPGDAGAPSATASGAEHEAAARELVLRALRAASDPLNDRMLRRLAEGDATLTTLSELVTLPRLAVWERLSDLVQTGLVARSLERDEAGLTAAGRALLELIGDAAAAAAGEART